MTIEVWAQALIALAEFAKVVAVRESPEHLKARERIDILVMNGLADAIERHQKKEGNDDDPA